MSSFQSAPLPLVTRLFANPILHITVISIFVIAGTLYIIGQQRKQEIVRRMEYLRGGPMFADAADPKPASAKTQQTAEASSEISNEIPVPPPPTSVAESSAQNAAAGSGSSSRQGFLPSQRNMATINEPQDRGQIRPQNPREIKLKVHYLLSPKPNLIRLLQEGQSQRSFVDFGEVKMGVIKNSASLLTGMDNLETIEKTVALEGPELIWHVGEKSENGVGMTAKVMITGRDNQSLRGEIEILKSFYEGTDRGAGPTLKVFGPAEFEVAPKSSLFLTMMLPTVAQSENATTGFMRLFQMNNFLQRQSEFVLVIDFE